MSRPTALWGSAGLALLLSPHEQARMCLEEILLAFDTHFREYHTVGFLERITPSSVCFVSCTGRRSCVSFVSVSHRRSEASFSKFLKCIAARIKVWRGCVHYIGCFPLTKVGIRILVHPIAFLSAPPLPAFLPGALGVEQVWSSSF